MSDFYITLPSSVPNSQFPNTSSRYVTRLPDVLTLERDKYRVAATDIIYPYSFVNVGKALDFWIHFRPAASSSSPPRIPVHVSFPPAQYSTADQIVRTLNNDNNVVVEGGPASRMKRAAVDFEISRAKRAKTEGAAAGGGGESIAAWNRQFESLGGGGGGGGGASSKPKESVNTLNQQFNSLLGGGGGGGATSKPKEGVAVLNAQFQCLSGGGPIPPGQGTPTETKDPQKPAPVQKDQQKPAPPPPPPPPEKKDQKKPAPTEKKDQKKPAAEKKDQQKPAPPPEQKDPQKPAPPPSSEKKDQKTPAPAGAETKKEETIADWNRQFESLSGGTPAGGETTTTPPPESVADLNRQFMSLSGKPKPAPPENQPTQQPAPPIVQKKGDGDVDDTPASANRDVEVPCASTLPVTLSGILRCHPRQSRRISRNLRRQIRRIRRNPRQQKRRIRRNPQQRRRINRNLPRHRHQSRRIRRNLRRQRRRIKRNPQQRRRINRNLCATEQKDQKKPEEKKDQKKPAAEKKDQQKPAPTEKKDQKKPAPTEKKDQKTPAPAGAETKKEETVADWNRQFESLSGGTPAGGETTTTPPPESVADLNRQFMSLSGKPKPAPPENQPTQQPAPPIVQKKGDGDDDDSVASWNRQFESLGTRGETIDAWNQQFLSLEKQRAEHDEAWPLYAASSMLLLHNKSTDPTTYQQQVEEFRKLRAKISTSHTSTSRGLLHFSNVGDQIKIEFLDGDISFVEFDETCAYFLGFTDPIVTKSQPAHKKVDYFGNVSTLYLYCDVVDPIIVGNTKSSLLSVIPCRGAYGEMIHHTVTHPRYLPLMNSTIDSIRVELLTEFGEPIDFNWGSTIIVLHFKRIE
ncbi:hypothetical protein CRE_20531 [Caenorhabditis remanei]|uniref:Uncharacterized protein n=1 Tax=Caenorhabditis remanei TaxID=31234 RepID=E3N8B8_CAERE|nr:hypothetical protein CRE_20531 [Caenorhabditis remanei]